MLTFTLVIRKWALCNYYSVLFHLMLVIWQFLWGPSLRIWERIWHTTRLPGTERKEIKNLLTLGESMVSQPQHTSIWAHQNPFFFFFCSCTVVILSPSFDLQHNISSFLDFDISNIWVSVLLFHLGSPHGTSYLLFYLDTSDYPDA